MMRTLPALLQLLALAHSLRVDPSLSRRAAIAGGASAAAALTRPAAPALALFESEQQQALIKLATAQPKLRGLVSEVAEVKRKRAKMAVDPEDDAYVFRFARSVLDPCAKEMVRAAPALPAATAQELTDEFNAQLAALNTACRGRAAAEELEALTSAEKALSDFLELASKAKYDVRPREDINGYEGSSGVLYNKLIFRSG